MLEPLGRPRICSCYSTANMHAASQRHMVRLGRARWLTGHLLRRRHRRRQRRPAAPLQRLRRRMCRGTRRFGIIATEARLLSTFASALLTKVCHFGCIVVCCAARHRHLICTCGIDGALGKWKGINGELVGVYALCVMRMCLCHEVSMCFAYKITEAWVRA